MGSCGGMGVRGLNGWPGEMCACLRVVEVWGLEIYENSI